MADIRVEADNNLARAEEAEIKLKKLEQELMQKDQEIVSLQHKVGNLEADVDKYEGKVAEHKALKDEGETHRTANENMSRKIALLESELDNADKNLRETTEKLRQVDVKAEHFERQVQRVESERDTWEKKWEEANEKYVASKREVDELVQQLESI